MNIEKEIMSEMFTKFHLKGMPVDAVIHRFTEADLSQPHDHPYSFKSLILYGGYKERQWYNSIGDYYREITHRPGDVFTVTAETIHQIIELPQGEC